MPDYKFMTKIGQWQCLTQGHFVELKIIKRGILVQKGLQDLLFGLPYGVTIQDINLNCLKSAFTLTLWDIFKDNI